MDVLPPSAPRVRHLDAATRHQISFYLTDVSFRLVGPSLMDSVYFVFRSRYPLFEHDCDWQN